MNKEKFIEILIAELAKKGIAAEEHQVQKIGSSYIGLIEVCDDDNKALPVVNIDRLYEGICAGELNLDEAVENAAEVLEMEYDPGFDVARIDEYEYIQSRLFVRICNPRWNDEYLEKIMHSPFGPYEVTYHVAVFRGAGELQSTPVSRDLFEKWGVSEEQLRDDAIASGQKLFPARKMPAREMFPFETDAFKLVLTNETGINGAAVIAYPGVLKKISEELDTDILCLIPSSIHEVIVGVPGAISVQEINNIIREVNQNIVSPDEWLDDKMAYYDAKQDKVQSEL